MITLKKNLVTVNGYHLAGILINEVFCPCFQNPCCQFTANGFFNGFFVRLNFFGEAEQIQNVFIVTVTDCTQQSGYGKFLFTVNVCIHHRVHIGCKFYPGSFERDDPCGVELGSVGVLAHGKEHAR